MRLLLCLLVVTGSCFAQDPARQAANSANVYAFKTFQLFRQITDGNFCFSPYSSQRMAALLAEGGKAETSDELLKLANVPNDQVQREAEASALSAELAASMGNGGLELEIANALWAPHGAAFHPGFTKRAADVFGAAARNLPANDPVQSAAAVNVWVRERTRNRITSIAGPNLFSPRAVALVNTIYVQGAWTSMFDPAKTKARAFIRPGGTTAPLPTMLQIGSFPYGESATWQALELPFGDGAASMIILLPNDEAARKIIEPAFSSTTWQAAVDALALCKVNVMLPKFSFSTQLSMTSMWQFLGARRLFESGKADFSGMLDQPGSYVKEVMHEATIEINERGTVASAATLVADPFGSPPAGSPPELRAVSFIASHPFLWVMRHNRTGLILVMGRFAGS